MYTVCYNTSVIEKVTELNILRQFTYAEFK